MSIETLIALFTIAASAAFTPGPNNALVASSAAIHGLRPTVPHILGITLGFPFMIFCVGLFLGEVFQQSAALRQTLRWLGVALLLWLAWRTATAGSTKTSQSRRPFTFLEAAGFQWVNPKGWTFAIAVTAQFVTVEAPIRTALICAAAFTIAGFGSASSWAIAGQAMTRWLNTPVRMRAFNVAMALLIASSVLLLFLG